MAAECQGHGGILWRAEFHDVKTSAKGMGGFHGVQIS